LPSIYFSEFAEVAPAALEEYGAFDVSLVSDLPLFVDPFLLFNSDNPDYQLLHEEILRYMRFLKKVTLESGLASALVNNWFSFPEVKQNWLGFSKIGNSGRGLGKDFAQALHHNFRSLFPDFGEETGNSRQSLGKALPGTQWGRARHDQRLYDESDQGVLRRLLASFRTNISPARSTASRGAAKVEV
jgi:hypothetical protein